MKRNIMINISKVLGVFLLEIVWLSVVFVPTMYAIFMYSPPRVWLVFYAIITLWVTICVCRTFYKYLQIKGNIYLTKEDKEYVLRKTCSKVKAYIFYPACFVFLVIEMAVIMLLSNMDLWNSMSYMDFIYYISYKYEDSIRMVVVLAALFSIFISRKYYKNKLQGKKNFISTSLYLFKCKKLAAQGDVECQMKLGRYYFDKKQYKKSVIWYKKAAEQGDVCAMIELANFYDNGKGVLLNEKYAKKLYDEALEKEMKLANDGNAKAQEKLGDWYRWGEEFLEKDENKAIEWYIRAAESYTKLVKQGDEDAMRDLANVQDHVAFLYHYAGGKYDMRRDVENSVLWYKKAEESYAKLADKGDVDAMLSQAKVRESIAFELYWRNSAHEDEGWYKRAFKIYQYLAKKGSPTALYHTGKCYEEGYGVEKDECTAFYCYKKSAKKYNKDAMYKLSFCYLYGIGTEKDPYEAKRWSKRYYADSFALEYERQRNAGKGLGF